MQILVDLQRAGHVVTPEQGLAERFEDRPPLRAGDSKGPLPDGPEGLTLVCVVGALAGRQEAPYGRQEER